MKYSYPPERTVEDVETGTLRGVVGQHVLLNEAAISSQPVVSFDWCTQKIGLAVAAALDYQIRLTIVTKLNLY